MIVPLHHQNKETAEQIRDVQIPAYQVEAELIGFDGIPALHETTEQLMQSGETFYGYRKDGKLAGVVAFETGENEDQAARANQIQITRLVVRPDCFRQGIAGELLRFVLALHGDETRYAVHTGAKNRPAIQLYEKYGFVLAGEREVAPDFYLAELIKEGGASR
ncbi:GNAT family N-acetyltransferase [Tumebacillus sp. DT12]|uniref:GNAT family N-acetyltransferase n=1 Tax=Tumebacillus lacus TaxID=2995335 RepID=A0ABT3X381_9BACL|nr:GNAT family N-acetyltransferase [Tumebacillus lacus]MCX7571364.1 GNAT family N-acetyltransferase [Tumebacillus lacus]